MNQYRKMAQLALSRGNTNPNAHMHPGNSLTRSVRHTHPNGAREHSHHYGK